MLSDEKLLTIFTDAKHAASLDDPYRVCKALRAVAEAAVKDAVGGEWNRIVLGKGLVGIHDGISGDGFPSLVFSRLGTGVVGEKTNHPDRTEIVADDILCEIVVESEAAFMVFRDALDALRIRPQASAAVPEGFVLVPRTLTGQMVDASGCDCQPGKSAYEVAQRQWDDMLAASEVRNV